MGINLVVGDDVRSLALDSDRGCLPPLSFWSSSNTPS